MKEWPMPQPLNILVLILMRLTSIQTTVIKADACYYGMLCLITVIKLSGLGNTLIAAQHPGTHMQHDDVATLTEQSPLVFPNGAHLPRCAKRSVYMQSERTSAEASVQ